ncbi:hypothetical protein ZWY2020_012646 [Hordeum vulgare]|nr:hypothetical protein ZWY2020_012646 [Hordeum vulgare]
MPARSGPSPPTRSSLVRGFASASELPDPLWRAGVDPPRRNPRHAAYPDPLATGRIGSALLLRHAHPMLPLACDHGGKTHCGGSMPARSGPSPPTRSSLVRGFASASELPDPLWRAGVDPPLMPISADLATDALVPVPETHVTTAVRGTVGHIAPEYLSTSQSSKKTYVFGFGVLLVELITGQKALDFGRLANQKGGVLDLVKKLHQEKQLNMMVEKDLGSNYDRVELEEMVQVALLCTQYYPSHRPRMWEVIRMLEGDGLVEKWEASQNVDTPKSVSSELLPLKFTNFAGADESSVGLEAMELSGPR